MGRSSPRGLVEAQATPCRGSGAWGAMPYRLGRPAEVQVNGVDEPFRQCPPRALAGTASGVLLAQVTGDGSVAGYTRDLGAHPLGDSSVHAASRRVDAEVEEARSEGSRACARRSALVARTVSRAVSERTTPRRRRRRGGAADVRATRELDVVAQINAQSPL
jgi:hypothetical protein